MRGLATPAVLLAATVATALCLPAPAQAAGPGSSVSPTMLTAAIPSAACHPDGVSADDTAVAGRVRPAMTGKRLGRSVNGQAISCARAIVRHVAGRGLPSRAAVIAVTTAITESTLHNYTVAVDEDSLGLFQQRPSMGWGRPEQLIDPAFATNAFLNKLIAIHPSNSWLTGDIGQICQRVQVSAYPGAYTPEVRDAQLIVEQLWPGPRSATRPSAGTSALAEPNKPAGPFQKSLLAATTGQGAADGRHQMLLADWNVDGHADLVVVQQSGTPGGGTEVHVLNGLSGLQHSVLLTATVLGATDARHAFAVADWNADGRPDLVVIQKYDTASGRTEVRVLDGAANLQRYLPETVTVLGPTDARHAFAVADWNADGRPDLVVTQKSGPGSNRTHVRVLDGATGLQSYLLDTATALGRTDARHEVAVADWNGDLRLDLVVMQKSDTGSDRTILRVLDGSSKYQRFLVRRTTVPVSTDDRHGLAVADFNGDGRQDLVVLQKWGTASGRTEARVLAG